MRTLQCLCRPSIEGLKGKKCIPLLSVRGLSWNCCQLKIDYTSEADWFCRILDTVKFSSEVVKDLFREVLRINIHTERFNVLGVLDVVRSGPQLLSITYRVDRASPEKGLKFSDGSIYGRCVIHDF